MKNILTILLIGILLSIKWASPKSDRPYSTVTSYLSLGEYYNLLLNGTTNQAWHLLNTIPQACTNQPTGGVAWVVGGPHDGLAGDPTGGLYVLGSVFSTGSGAFQHITVDSAGNALPFVTGGLCTASSTSPYWLDVIITNDSTTGRQVGMAGSISGGIHGNGDNSTVNQTSIVWVKFPAGANPHIVKVCGQYCLIALSSIGQVWSWGGSGNKAMLMRGTSPAVSYLLPDTIPLGGHHAIDIGSNGDVAVIVLDNHTILGGGDLPKYWGGSGVSTSNSPQDFTSFLTTSLGPDPATGLTFVPAKVSVNSGSISYWSTDSTLAGGGDNICGQIGNGQMFPMNNYKVSPPPNGSTPQPYAYDNGFNEFPQYTPVRIMPGSHNWIGPSICGPSNCWNNSVINSLRENWAWGRGKSMQTANGRASCQYYDGNLNGTYPDMINGPYPVKINPFVITSGNIVTAQCYYCVLNPGATSCSHGTSCYNGSLAAPIIAPANQSITGSICTITPSITYATGSKELWNFLIYYSGPGAVMPFNTGSSITLTNMAPGMHVIKDSSIDIMWKSTVSFDTIYVAAANRIIFPMRVVKSEYNEKNYLPVDHDGFLTFSE